MATGTDLRPMALALKGTTEGPHFDRGRSRSLSRVHLPRIGVFVTASSPHEFADAFLRAFWHSVSLISCVRET